MQTQSAILLSQRKISQDPNSDVAFGRITLGRNTFTANKHGFMGCPYGMVSINNRRSGLISLISGHSSGKSVLVKRIYAGIHMCEPNRPGVIFDMQGIDHRYSRDRSEEGDGIIFTDIGEHRWGFGKRLVSLTPFYLREECPYPGEVWFSIDWKKVSDAEWEYLLQQGSESKSWIYSFLWIVSKARETCETLHDFINEIEYGADTAPGDRRDDALLGRITRPECEAMLKSMCILRDRKVFVEHDDKLCVDIVEKLEQGYICVLNFHSDENLETKLYTGHIMRIIYSHYNRKAANSYPRLILAPWMVVEEFNKLSPAEAKSFGEETPGQKWVREIVTKGMKVGFKLLLVMQDAHDVNAKMRRNIFNDTVLCCNLTYADMKVMVQRFGGQYLDLLQSLDVQFDEHMTKEWALLEDGNVVTFRPGASPVKFHERFKQSRTRR